MRALATRLARLEQQALASGKQLCQCDIWAFDSEAAYQRAIAPLSPDYDRASQIAACPKCGRQPAALPVKAYIGLDLERV
jgi:hypothetical protein